MLHINDITYRIEGRMILDQATAAISEGWKVGFVGRNGTGKSTLLRLIREEITPDDGEINIRKNRRLGWVAQEAPATRDSLLDTVLAFDTERASLLAEAETATDGARIAEIQTRLSDIDAYSAEARAASILHGLGFSAAAQAQACADFSGGWRMRVALAGVLFSAPDVLLLDEPTNYLDLEGAIWLETYLQRYPYTALIVSHDREFLNRAVTHIMALEHGKLDMCPGDFDNWERRRAEARALAVSFKAKQEAQRRHMEAFVERFRYKASKAKQAQSRLKMLEKMKTTAIPIEERSIPFHFPNPKPMAPPIIRLVEADLGYTEGTPVLNKVTLRLDQDDRIGILGPNGEGKSTLVKSIAGRLPTLTGNLYKHKKLKIAYFAQHQLDELNPKQSAYDHVAALMPEGTQAQIRARTAQLGFGPDKADTAVAKLSGGEKARLLLGIITFDGAHMLILDEPTNHLDIDAREALVDALNSFAGAVLLITHDSHLAEAVADRLLLVKDGAVAPYDGDMNDYRALVLDTNKTAGKETKATTRKSTGPNSTGPNGTADLGAGRKQAAQAREAIAPLKKKAEAAEAKLDALGTILIKLDEALADPNLYKNPARMAKLNKERAALTDAMETTEQRWLEALEAYEAAQDA
ncbi:MAG: ABC-F family ATP-binding cassette domain-containing protein [Pseudomonadota bacterium]